MTRSSYLLALAAGVLACSPTHSGVSSGTTAAGTTGSSNSTGASSGGGSPCQSTDFFCDDFTNPALATAYTTENGSWVRASGSETVTDGNSGERAVAFLAPSVATFDITIDGYGMGQSGFGLEYAGVDASTGYAVLVHPQEYHGVYLKELVPGTGGTNLASYTLPDEPIGTPHVLRVTRVGSLVTVWLDGAQVISQDDCNPTGAGRIGLLTSTTDMTAGAGSEFTLFRVVQAASSSASSASSSSSGSSASGSSGTGTGGSSGVPPIPTMSNNPNFTLQQVTTFSGTTFPANMQMYGDEVLAPSGYIANSHLVLTGDALQVLGYVDPVSGSVAGVTGAGFDLSDAVTVSGGFDVCMSLSDTDWGDVQLVLISWPTDNIWGDGENDFFDGSPASPLIFVHQIGSSPQTNVYYATWPMALATGIHVVGARWDPTDGYLFYLDGTLVDSAPPSSTVLTPTTAHQLSIQMQDIGEDSSGTMTATVYWTARYSYP